MLIASAKILECEGSILPTSLVTRVSLIYLLVELYERNERRVVRTGAAKRNEHAG